MKKTVLFLLGIIFTTNLFAQQDPTLLEIDGKKVTKSEFLQIYLKNNNDPKYDKESLDGYMELFKKFKLKVAEAEAMGYDTIPKLKRELEGYQKQLALPYLTDSKMNESLVKEAYDHMKNEVRASHILIRLEPNPTAADTLAAYNKIMALKARIDKGEDFTYVAKGKGGSEDPSVANNGGDLGYFTAFQMVYPFEDMAYKTPVGSVSKPFRTKFGYHILKVTDKRPARGTIKVAHLMIAANKNNSSKEEIESARNKANELYEKLQKGENFEMLVSQFSDDPSSNNNSGVLPLFGTGTTTRMVGEFEDAAFKLAKDGDISEPVQTDYGFHIIKRIELTDLRPFNELEKELQNRVNRDERSKLTQSSFIQKLKKDYNFSDKSAKSIKWFKTNIDSTYLVGKWKAENLKTNDKMVVLDGKTYGQKDFAAYLVANYKSARKSNLSDVVDDLYKAWQDEIVLDLEKSKLEAKYPEYKALMNEYHDGILLYEIMSDEVWNKAMSDSTGLKNFYEANKANYVWGKRVDAVVYETISANVAADVEALLKKGLSSDSISKIINKDSELNLRVRTNKFEVEKTNYLANQSLNLGVNKAYSFEGKFYVVDVKEKIEASQKELSEAKGLITSDYQNYLEKEWIEKLEQKHTIKVYDSVLYSLGK